MKKEFEGIIIDAVYTTVPDGEKVFRNELIVILEPLFKIDYTKGLLELKKELHQKLPDMEDRITKLFIAKKKYKKDPYPSWLSEVVSKIMISSFNEELAPSEYHFAIANEQARILKDLSLVKRIANPKKVFKNELAYLKEVQSDLALISGERTIYTTARSLAFALEENNYFVDPILLNNLRSILVNNEYLEKDSTFTQSFLKKDFKKSNWLGTSQSLVFLLHLLFGGFTIDSSNVYEWGSDRFTIKRKKFSALQLRNAFYPVQKKYRNYFRSTSPLKTQEIFSKNLSCIFDAFKQIISQ